MVVEAQSVFHSCTAAPPDPVLNLSVAYRVDTNPRKVDLGVGAYRDEKGHPFIFRAVRLAEEAIMKDHHNNHEYCAIEGPKQLKPLTLALLLGKEGADVHGARVVSAQTISGTGALRVCAEFLATRCGANTVYISDPTWANHRAIFANVGMKVSTYPYWDKVNRCVDISGWMSTLEQAAHGSVVVLHACAHNPTGCDPSESEMAQIIQLIVRRGLIAVVDSAYQGYASGDLEKDSFMIREFARHNAEFLVTQSFAKNMGLYGERFGMIHIFTQNNIIAENVLSQLKTVIRPMYSSPPIHGGKIVLQILGNPELYTLWLDELKQVSDRIKSVREELSRALESKTGNDWSHIRTQIGMFSFTGLTPAQCDRMTKQWHIYMMTNGRISVAGINPGNIEYVTEAFIDSVNNA